MVRGFWSAKAVVSAITVAAIYVVTCIPPLKMSFKWRFSGKSSFHVFRTFTKSAYLLFLLLRGDLDLERLPPPSTEMILLVVSAARDWMNSNRGTRPSSEKEIQYSIFSIIYLGKIKKVQANHKGFIKRSISYK